MLVLVWCCFLNVADIIVQGTVLLSESPDTVEFVRSSMLSQQAISMLCLQISSFHSQNYLKQALHYLSMQFPLIQMLL